MNEKVYCSECKFYIGGAVFECHHTKNLINIDTWYKRDIECSNSANIINKNNNCKWFESFTECEE